MYKCILDAVVDKGTWMWVNGELFEMVYPRRIWALQYDDKIYVKVEENYHGTELLVDYDKNKDLVVASNDTKGNPFLKIGNTDVLYAAYI